MVAALLLMLRKGLLVCALPAFAFLMGFWPASQAQAACTVDENGTYIEAENYNTGGAGWAFATSTSGHNGTGYLQASDSDTSFPVSTSPVQYTLNFPSTGVYYIWFRGRDSGPGINNAERNSLWYGLDGAVKGNATTPVNTDNVWDWTNTRSDTAPSGTGPSPTQFNITSVGNHTIYIWPREADFKFDGFYLRQTNSRPAGNIPAGATVIDPTSASCTAPPFDADGDGFTIAAGDCNDADAAMFPGNPDNNCDGKDNDCNGIVDQGCDMDGDGSLNSVDCNDTDPTIYPGAADNTCNGVDNNCNGTIDEGCDPDNDGDGFTVGEGDCADNNLAIHPGVIDNSCNNVDDNCNGTIDEDCDPDNDGDGFTQMNDCNDADPAIHPNAIEICLNQEDDDCDGFADEGCDSDTDGDTYTKNNADLSLRDCDDTNAAIHPGAAELCDGVDNNCDGAIDSFACDADGDGYSDTREYLAGTDPGDPNSLPQLTLTVDPVSLPSDTQGTITLTVTNLRNLPAPATIDIKRLFDPSGTNHPDYWKPTTVRFQVTDGAAPVTRFGAGDSDGVADGAVTVVLNAFDSGDLLHLPGSFIYKVWDGHEGSVATTQLVTPAVFPQSVSGTVAIDGNPAASLLMVLENGFGVVGRAFTDTNGQYTLEVSRPGSYRLYPMDPAWGTATDLANAQAITVTPGAALTGYDFDLPVGTACALCPPYAYPINGQVTDGSRGMVGALVEARSSDGRYLARAVTFLDGIYLLQVPPGTWRLGVVPAADFTQSPSFRGAVGFTGGTRTVVVTDTSVLGVDFTVAPGTTTLSGTVRDAFGLPVPGLGIVARVAGSPDPALDGATAGAVTGADGAYQLPVIAATPWSVGLDPASSWNRQLVADPLQGIAVRAYRVAGQDLTVMPGTPTLPPVASATLTADRPSPQAPGTMVRFTAGGVGGGCAHEYRYFTRPEGGSWTAVPGGYSPQAFFDWDTTGLSGQYYVQVYVRNIGSSINYEAAKATGFIVAAVIPAQSANLVANKVNPVAAGTTVRFTADGVGGSGPYEYSFFTMRSWGSWVAVPGGYTTQAFYDWDTSGLPMGTYYVRVYVRNVGSTATYEAAKSVGFFVFIVTPAQSATLAANKVSPQPAGTTVRFTAGGTGGSGPYEYKFFTRPAGGSWAAVPGGYTTQPNYDWDTTGLSGQHYLQVYVRNVGSGANYEAAKALGFLVH